MSNPQASPEHLTPKRKPRQPPQPRIVRATDEERAFTAAAGSRLELPAELAAWRTETGGVVQVSARGVVLHRWEGAERVEACFETMTSAVEALLADLVRWNAPQKRSSRDGH